MRVVVVKNVLVAVMLNKTTRNPSNHTALKSRKLAARRPPTVRRLVGDETTLIF